MTWRYQDEAGVARTPTRHLERRTRSVSFLRWIDQLWSHRRVVAHERLYRLAQTRLAYTSDWRTAVRIVQRAWPGSSSWLLSCSSSEGGWAYWKWNGGSPYSGPSPPAGSSGAGGWMQYMSGTFYGDYDAAIRKARELRRVLPPSQSRSWLSAEGQAYAAGYAYFYSRPAGKWTGSAC